MELWTFLNPILKIFFYLSVVGTAGTALFIFHFRKLMEKENILFCYKVMLTSSVIFSAGLKLINNLASRALFFGDCNTGLD